MQVIYASLGSAAWYLLTRLSDGWCVVVNTDKSEDDQMRAVGAAALQAQIRDQGRSCSAAS